MKMNEILDVIIEFSYSQGFWGRLYEDIMELKHYDPMGYDDLVEDWEGRNFSDALDFIMFVEGC